VIGRIYIFIKYLVFEMKIPLPKVFVLLHLEIDGPFMEFIE
jgi:hypothetical protein